jgi:hypothetical protein
MQKILNELQKTRAAIAWRFGGATSVLPCPGPSAMTKRYQGDA